VNANYRDDALHIPVDHELLDPLGRVEWAAIRLHHGIRDAINQLNGRASDKPFDLTLGMAVTKLENKVRAQPAGPERDALLAWCADAARSAVNARDRVIHAVAYTAPDGKQALMDSEGQRERFTADRLLEVAGQLAAASRTQPPTPCASPSAPPPE
jgi:hypothetical protein